MYIFLLGTFCDGHGEQVLIGRFGELEGEELSQCSLSLVAWLYSGYSVG